jgi:uncharacterized protein YndB with AHSA1/START domain
LYFDFTRFKEKELIANASTAIKAPIMHVWEALTTPSVIKKFMLGTEVQSNWEEGEPISWEGELDGKAYADKGTILKLDPGKILQYSQFSTLSGLPDEPENYHTITYSLWAENGRTQVAVSQDNNKNDREVEHSEKLWCTMLAALKKQVELSERGV